MTHSDIQPLLDKISNYFDAISPPKTQQNREIPNYIKLDPRLFSNENETIEQCIAQAQNSLQALKQSHDPIQSEFYAEKLVAQYHTLLEITHPKSEYKPHFTPVNSTARAQKEEKHKEKHSVHDLPPAERLKKYYQFLTQLNDLIAQQNEQLLCCEDNLQQQLIEKINLTEQRKKRCLDAIDNLEEYLLFVAERAKG